ncbi:MAG TPA: DnaJ domain-containing protein, partial [Fimbriimonadaceae bacterium]|nr:DnaJ domain-containing protein [Fimbriimonadaceae bacterium]
MARTHYDVLGVHRKSTAVEIRSAYRRLVLRHHPDRSKSPNAAEVFMRIVEAYEVLSDGERRRQYDRSLALAEERAARQERPEAVKRSQTAPGPKARAQAQKPRAASTQATGLAGDLARLTMLYGRGKYAEAETLAQAVIRMEPREAIPYAVLGDIARARGDLGTAANMYAHAVQMDPRNPVYQQRHEELIRAVPGHRASTREGSGIGAFALVAGPFVALLAAIYIAISREAALMPTMGLISTWTLGLVVMLFLCGVVVGVSLSLGGLVDRFSSVNTTSLGGISPTLALGSIALFSFWAAAALYVGLG